MVKPRENRVPIMMSDDELTSIDDWRFANRVATRSEAVRRLLRIGLALDHGTPAINKAGNALSAEMEAVGRVIEELSLKNPALTESEAVAKNADQLIAPYYQMHKALDVFMDAVAAVSMEHLDLLKERNLSKAMQNADETRRLFSTPFEEDEK